MATVTKVYTPGNLIQSFADVYINVAAPPSSLTPTADANCITLDANGQPTDTGSAGFHLGSIEGPTMININEKTNDILDDQHESAIDIAFDNVEGEIDFVMKETNLSRLRTILASNGLSTFTSLTNSKAWQIGGQLANSQYSSFTVMLVAPDRKTAGKFWYAFAFKAFLKSPIQAALTRTKESVYKLKVGCIMDSSRVAGDELLQIIRTK